MSKKTISVTSQKSLKTLRKQIDAADHQLLKALGARFKAVQKVGVIKRKEKLPIYQKARWQEVVKERVKQAKAQKVSEPFTRAFLNLIHKEAIRIQKRGSSTARLKGKQK